MSFGLVLSLMWPSKGLQKPKNECVRAELVALVYYVYLQETVYLRLTDHIQKSGNVWIHLVETLLLSSI